jgi:hypothetical protein
MGDRQRAIALGLGAQGVRDLVNGEALHQTSARKVC